MIAQAFGEYATVSTLWDGVRWIGFHLQEFGREWGLTGAVMVVAAALAWRMFTRVK